MLNYCFLKQSFHPDPQFSITDLTSNKKGKRATTSVVAPQGNCLSHDYIHCPAAGSEAPTIDFSPDTPVMGQRIQFENSNELPEVSEIADSQQTAVGSQFSDLGQLPVDSQMELSPIPRPSGAESNDVAFDCHHFEEDSEEGSQDLPASQASKASSRSRSFAIGSNETCPKLLKEAQQGHVYDIPPPVSVDTMFQLELSCLESVDEILIPEGIDITKCSWDETTDADLDVLVKALNYSNCVQNEVSWRIGRFICKSYFLGSSMAASCVSNTHFG